MYGRTRSEKKVTVGEKVTAGEKKTTNQLELQSALEPSQRVSLQGPPGMFPERPKSGDRVIFTYRYELAGWRQTEVEVIHSGS